MGFVLKFVWDHVFGFFDRVNYWVTTMDFTQWLYVLVAAVVFGFLLLRGHSDKIGS